MHKLSDYGCGGTSVYPSIKLYIDDVEQNTYTGDALQNWKDAVIAVSAGNHTLKWRFIRGFTKGDPYCGNGAPMGTGYVDNIYIIANP
jgi:hypothetical protein